MAHASCDGFDEALAKLTTVHEQGRALLRIVSTRTADWDASFAAGEPQEGHDALWSRLDVVPMDPVDEVQFSSVHFHAESPRAPQRAPFGARQDTRDPVDEDESLDAIYDDQADQAEGLQSTSEDLQSVLGRATAYLSVCTTVIHGLGEQAMRGKNALQRLHKDVDRVQRSVKKALPGGNEKAGLSASKPHEPSREEPDPFIRARAELARLGDKLRRSSQVLLMAGGADKVYEAFSSTPPTPRRRPSQRRRRT